MDLEKKSYTEEGLAVIAAHSDGSMRDSLSILDQVLSMGNDTVDGETVYDALGLTEEEGIFRIVDGLLTADGALIVDALDRAYDRGKNFALLLDAIIDYFRDLLFYEYTKTPPKGYSESDRAAFKAHAENLDKDFGFRCLELFQKGREQFRYAKDPRAVVEILLLKALHLQVAGDLPEERPQPIRPAAPIKKAPPKKAEPSKREEPADTQADAGEEPAPLSGNDDRDIIQGEKSPLDGDKWQAVQSAVQARSVACAALLKDAEETKLEGNLLTILFQPKFSFHIQMLKNDANEAALAEGVREVLGPDAAVRVEAIGDEDDTVLQSLERVFKDVTIEKE